MTMIIRYAPSFRRAFRKLSFSDQERVRAVLHLFQKNPFDPRLKNHKLSGFQEGMYSISGGYDLRILYVQIESYTVVMLVNVGTHNEVY